MKKTVFRFGLLSGLVIILLSAGSFLLTAKTRDYDTQEIIGYLTIFISMVFVFIGIKHYRDRVNKGSLSFGEGLKVGLLIVLIYVIDKPAIITHIGYFLSFKFILK